MSADFEMVDGEAVEVEEFVEIGAHPLARIVWMDSFTRPVFGVGDELPSAVEVEGYGYIMGRDAVSLIVAQFLSDDGGAINVVAIPLGTIKQVDVVSRIAEEIPGENIFTSFE